MNDNEPWDEKPAQGETYKLFGMLASIMLATGALGACALYIGGPYLKKAAAVHAETVTTTIRSSYPGL